MLTKITPPPYVFGMTGEQSNEKEDPKIFNKRAR
jgi:hypothetical protein